MEQDEITKIYETLAPMAGNYANAQAEQIGQAQRSMGPMAANVMGQSQTSGLGNYTYNRLMRPQVDAMRDEIRVQGYVNQLNRLLSDALTNARNNYNRRSRSSGGGTKTPSGVNEDPVKNYTDDDDAPADSTSGELDSVSTTPSTAVEGEYNVGTATVNGETRIVTKNDKNNLYHIQGDRSYRPGSSDWEDAKKKYNVKLNPYPGANPLLTF